MNIYLEHVARLCFLEGQMELYKQKYIDTDNRKYLEVMNEMNKTIDYVRTSYEIINNMAKQLETKN